MEPEALTVVVPHKDGIGENTGPVEVWPLVLAALDRIGVDEATRDAAREAMKSSAGLCALGNFLDSEAKRIPKMDYGFKVPVIVAAAQMARTDGLADSFYCPDDGAVYFETDEDQFAFGVQKDWVVDWASVADEVVDSFDWSGEEEQAWALERLLSYLDMDLGPYGGDEEEEEAD